MALIPMIFKNDDDYSGTTPRYSRTGKVPPAMSRVMNSYSFYNKTGVFHGYANECNATHSYDTATSKVTITFNKGIVSVYGGVMLIEDGTQFSFTSGVNTSGYIGVSVDLSKDAGGEAFLFGKTAGFNTDDLLLNDLTGKFDFIMYKYVVDGTGKLSITKHNQFSNTDGEFAYVYDTTYIVDSLVNGSLIAKKSEVSEKSNSVVFVTEAPTQSPPEGTIVIYVGDTAPVVRYDRVLYLIV